jgi:hypothetical protein
MARPFWRTPRSATLANTVTFYDSLRRDIQSSYGYIVDGVQKVFDRHPTKKLYHEVAKSVAVLQILENLPVTAKNIAALLHPTIVASSVGEDVGKAIEELLKDGFIPLGEKNGSLRFLTQAAVTLQKEFDHIEYRNADIRSELNKSVRALFKPLPSARLNNVRPVTAGIRVAIGGGQSVSLEGDKEPIQIQTEFVSPSAYEQTRKERENDSRASRERTSIFLLGRTDPETEKLAVTLVRCQKFVDAHRNASDPETQDFVRIVSERSERTASDLEKLLKKALVAGSFIAHGAHRPVSELDADLAEASKIFLADAAAKVFDRYAEAPVQVEGSVAEKFLKTPLDRITTAEDPLQLVTRGGGHARIRTDHKALLSIKDYLSQTGWVEGRRLLEHFNEPPFGWSKDTTRYLLGALFVGMELKFRIAGRDHLVRNDETLGALSSNKALGSVGIASREERPDPDALFRASDRLRDLSGENVLPLEDDIASAAKKHFPGFQQDYSALAAELRNLRLAGAERADDLSADLTEVVRGDGSDAVARLGGVDSALYDSLKWARKVKQAFAQGLRETVADLQHFRSEIELLPDSGIPGQLKTACADHLSQVSDILSKDAFYNQSAALQTVRHELVKQVETAVTDVAKQQAHLRETELTKWQKLPDWADLLSEDRAWFGAEVEKLAVDVSGNIVGLRRLLAHEYDLNHHLRKLETEVSVLAEKRRAEREEVLKPDNGTPPKPVDVEITVPAVIERAGQLEMLVGQIQGLRAHLTAGQPVRIHWKEQTKS